MNYLLVPHRKWKHFLLFIFIGRSEMNDFTPAHGEHNWRPFASVTSKLLFILVLIIIVEKYRRVYGLFAFEALIMEKIAFSCNHLRFGCKSIICHFPCWSLICTRDPCRCRCRATAEDEECGL